MFESREGQYLVLLLLESLEMIFFLLSATVIFAKDTHKLVLLSLCGQQVCDSFRSSKWPTVGLRTRKTQLLPALLLAEPTDYK